MWLLLKILGGQRLALLLSGLSAVVAAMRMALRVSALRISVVVISGVGLLASKGVMTARASALTVGETGAVKGEVVAESVVVRGTVEGRIRGRKVQLCTGAKVRGDIFHASLAIEPNAIFEGAVKHAQDPMADPPTGT